MCMGSFQLYSDMCWELKPSTYIAATDTASRSVCDRLVQNIEGYCCRAGICMLYSP